MSEKELFTGLDSIVFDQPTSIDVSDFNKAEVKTEDKTAPAGKDEKETKETLESKEETIDPNEFFNRVKDKTEDKADDADSEEEEEKEEDAPENIITEWSNVFKEKLLLNEADLEGFDGSIESLVSSFEKREYRVGIEMVEDYKAQLPSELKFLADNWEEGVPLDKLIDIRSNKIKYSLITDENLEESVDTQKSVYRDYLKQTTKYSDAKIEKEITRLVDLDELHDEAKDSLKELKIVQAEAEETLKKETKKQKELRLEENAKQIKAYEKYISTTKEVIPGLKISEKEQADIFNKIINPIGIDGYGNPVSYINSIRNTDPYKFDMAVHYLASITTDKKGNPFEDWSKIVGAGETKATKSLEKVLNTAPPKTSKDNIKTDKKQSLMDLLERNKSIFGK